MTTGIDDFAAAAALLFVRVSLGVFWLCSCSGDPCNRVMFTEWTVLCLCSITDQLRSCIAVNVALVFLHNKLGRCRIHRFLNYDSLLSIIFFYLPYAHPWFYACPSNLNSFTCYFIFRVRHKISTHFISTSNPFLNLKANLIYHLQRCFE